MSLNEIVPAAWRKPLYVAYALVGVALGAVATVYGGVENVPDYVATINSVWLYVGGAFGLVAGANTVVEKTVRDTEDDPAVGVDDSEDEPLDAEDGEEELDDLELEKADEQAELDESLT